MSYDFIKALHILAFISWMAGLFYFPRLLVYHIEQAAEFKAESLFNTMQSRLYRYIMQPAMVVTLVTGLWLMIEGGFYKSGWMHAKLLCVICLLGFHVHLWIWHKKLFEKKLTFTGKQMRILNEVPTVILIVIVFLVIFKSIP